MKNNTILTMALLAGLAVNAGSQEVIQVKGSDTMVNLAQRLAEVFMEKNPGAAVAVTGGGSGVGIAALIADRVAVANSSREIAEKEMVQAKENGVVPVEVVLGIDGLCVITSEAVGLKSLTMAQIGTIYRGEIKNWNEVGGPNLPVSLYGRQPSSGTYVFFQEHVMGKKDYSPKMKQMNGNAQIVEAVKAEKGGIGYVGVGYALDETGHVQQGIKVLDVSKDAKSPVVSPLNAENVKSGRYPIARPLYQYLNGKPNAAVKSLIAFELSSEGQKIVEEMGFYAVSDKWIQKNKKAGF
jgi:phosphate transport system substrate-binding protein